MTIEKKTIANINYYLLLLIIFSIPLLKGLTPPLIILWVLSSLFLFDTSNFKILKNKALFYSIIFYYLLMVISFLWTDNIKFGLTYLETGVPFLAFPIFFVFTKNTNYKNITTILSAFIFGNLLAIFFNIARALYQISKLEMTFNFEKLFSEKAQYFLTYSEFSFFNHPTYASIYAVFAIVSVFYIVFQLSKSKKYLLTLFIFIPSIFLYSSKGGILALLVIIALIILISIIKYNKIGISSLILLLFIIVSILFVKNNERINNFFNKNLSFNKKDNTSNTDARILIWQSNIELVKENILLGTGIGDYKDEVIKIYKKNEYLEGVEKKFNAHNQFIENFASMGIFGLLNLLFVFILALFISIKEKRIPELLFLTIIGLNLLFESMFNTQAGVIFFTFFFSYLFFSNYSEKNISE